MRSFSVFAASLILAACSMNPRLERPPQPVASDFAGTDSGEPASAAAIDWREMFRDARLQQLIELALANNRDLRIAALNVEGARAQFRVARGARLPAIDATGSYTRQRIAPGGLTGTAGGDGNAQGVGSTEFGQFTANAALTSFEIDLFGRLRSLSQAAFERYLSSEEGHRAARIALIGSVVDAYLAERLAQEQLSLTESTLVAWRQSLDITRRLRAADQSSGLDVVQSEGLVRQAEADREARIRALARATNQLQLLVGATLPQDLPPPMPLMDQPILTELPAGLPSDLLVNRPDIRQAEHDLAAANADVGAARAAFFPRLSLTGLLGFASPALSGLIDGDRGNWSFTPQIALPIFRGGALRGELRLAEVRKSVAVAQYERAIQIAFREVSDGLAGRATYARQLKAQAAATDMASQRVRLAKMRHRAGIDSRLELLDAQRSDYAARQSLLDLRREELSSASGLYRALGGADR